MKRAIIAAALAVAVLAVALTAGLVSLDTYRVAGISVGLNSSYCSADIQSLEVKLSCETAQ